MCSTVVTSPLAVQGSPPAQHYAAPQAQMAYAMPPTSQPMMAAQGGPVMPLPNMISQHLSPMGGAPSHGGAFPAQQPAMQQQPAPTWQAPGLGQTLLEATPQMAAPMSSPGMMGGFLPSARSDGQMPMMGSPSAVAPAQAAWGSGFPQRPATEPSFLPQRSTSNLGHSSLIPGAPTLPSMGSAPRASNSVGSLLGRGLPSAPLAVPIQNFDSPVGALSAGMAPQSMPSARTRSLKKPKRSSNVFMVALALILLAGFVAAAGWLFREPIMQVVERFKPVTTPPVEAVQVTLPATTETSKVVEIAKPDVPLTAPVIPTGPQMAESAAPQITTSFDPSQAAPPAPPLKAQPASASEIAESMTKPAASNPEAGLVEVPAKAPTSAVMVPESNDVTTTSEHKDLKLEVPDEAKPAAEALQNFLNAQTLQERLKYTLAPDAMKPIMDRYYSANPDGPIRVDAVGLVTYHPKPQIGGGAHAIFGVESKTWEFPVPVMLENTGGKFKVDWLSFVEFKDRLLEKFLHTYDEGPARFHVGITRTHYFEDKVPNSAGKEAFRISPAPPNPFLATVFVDKESTLGRDLRDKIPWGAQVFAIVELEWMKLGNQAWVQLSGVPQLNWYSVPSAPKAVRAGSSSSIEVPTETQKAVPIGR